MYCKVHINQKFLLALIKISEFKEKNKNNNLVT